MIRKRDLPQVTLVGFSNKMPRRKPFSNKQKKQQLQQKREKKKLANLGISYLSLAISVNAYATDDMEKPEKNDSERDSDSSEHTSEEEVAVIKVHHQLTAKGGYDPNR